MSNNDTKRSQKSNGSVPWYASRGIVDNICWKGALIPDYWCGEEEEVDSTHGHKSRAIKGIISLGSMCALVRPPIHFDHYAVTNIRKRGTEEGYWARVTLQVMLKDCLWWETRQPSLNKSGHCRLSSLTWHFICKHSTLNKSMFENSHVRSSYTGKKRKTTENGNPSHMRTQSIWPKVRAEHVLLTGSYWSGNTIQ